MIHVRYERGLYLPAQDLWLDPWEAKRFAFVSHAHSDHIAPHDEIIVSERTAPLAASPRTTRSLANVSSGKAAGPA
jgi:DNA ligase-1